MQTFNQTFNQPELKDYQCLVNSFANIDQGSAIFDIFHKASEKI